MQVHLNGVSVALLGYLQTHKPDYLETIKTQGQVATTFLNTFEKEASLSAPLLSKQIRQLHDAQRETTLTILNADNEQQAALSALDKNRAALLQTLQEKFLMSTRSAAWRGSDRLRWILTAVSEAKALAPAATINAQSFHFALEQYRQEASPRQRTVINEASKQWDICVNAVRKMAETEALKTAALSRFTQQRQELDQALDSYQRANQSSNADSLQTKTKAIEPYVMTGLIGCGILAFGMLLRGRSSNKKDIEEMINCVDAAAAGDLRRLAVDISDPAVKRLAHSWEQLSAVMVRSENLVYHLAALVESSGDAIVSQTLEGTILSWNKGAQRMYGYSVEEVRGQSIGLLNNTDGGATLRTILARVREGEKIAPFEAVHQAKNGRKVRALVKVSAIYDSLHKVIGASFCAQELNSSLPATDLLGKN